MRNLATYRRSGFTLVELLVVMVIIVSLVGLSLGGYFYMERSSRFRRAMSEAEAVFIAAAQTARWLQAPAWVIIDPEKGELTSYGLETVASWHFEENEASQGIPLVFKGNVQMKGGYAGSGILVGMDPQFPEGGAVASVPAGKFPNGGYFECYVKPMDSGKGQVVFRWGKTVSLTIVEGLRLEGRIGGETLRNPDVRVNAFRWARFGILFSRDYVSIMMDDAVLAGRQPRDFPVLEGQVELPAVDAPVHGYVDEARLLRVRELGKWVRQSGLAPTGDDRTFVWFRPDGTLDASLSPGPITVGIKADGAPGQGFTVTVTPDGEVKAAPGGGR